MLPVWWDDIKYFKPSEFDSPDEKGSGGTGMNEDFVRLLDELRSLLGRPLIITSGYRTATLNSDIGGSPQSKHLEGIAADIRAYNGYERATIVDKALDLGFKGIGVYDKHIHLDTRGQKFAVMWSGNSK